MPRDKQWYYYDSNNSGGGWWLGDDDWKNLEQEGWVVCWVKDEEGGHRGSDRWLGALATSAAVQAASEGEAIAQFEAITGQNFDDEGCSCCGSPHSIMMVRPEEDYYMRKIGRQVAENSVIDGEVIVKEIEAS